MARTACESPLGWGHTKPVPRVREHKRPPPQVHFPMSVSPAGDQTHPAPPYRHRGEGAIWVGIFKNWNSHEIKKIPELGLSEGGSPCFFQVTTGLPSRGKIQASAVTEKSLGTEQTQHHSEGKYFRPAAQSHKTLLTDLWARHQSSTRVWTHCS